MPRVPATIPRQRQQQQQQQPYGFNPQQGHGYYYEDTEGYVGDYSESDALSDAAPSLQPPLRMVQRGGDVTEIYRRKNAVSPRYQNVYMPTEYYYEQPVPQQVRVAPAQPVYRKRIVVHPQYAQPPPPQGVYHPSLPHVAAGPRALPRTPSASAVRQVGQQPQIIRRHPVTVRTPRYVRRPAAAAIYKRPSALCLPIACQPDPANCRRIRRVIPSEVFQQEVYPAKVLRRPSYSAPPPSPPVNKPLVRKESKKNLDITKTRLDAILERYEKIFGKSPEAKQPPESGDQEVKHLKPRESLPTQIQTITKEEIPGIMKTAETFEVEEITSEVLDELLCELNEHGFNDIIDEEDRRKIFESKLRRQAQPETKIIAEKCENELTTIPKESMLDMPEKDLPKSFNYQEIQNSLSKCNNGGFSSEIEEVKSQKSLKMRETPQTQKVTTMPKLNAADALELHRTKSYVVNLIDTALSNHFGTNVSQKNANSKESMDARSAVEMLKRQSCCKMDKDLCFEIAQVLTDSFHNTPGVDLNKGSQCSCKSQIPEEPPFVKQLKQMRWGHLKHIQREVRRLEDLERFLDSCSTATCDKTCEKYQSP